MAKDTFRNANRELLEAVLDDGSELTEAQLAPLFTNAVANNRLVLLKVAIWLADHKGADVDRALALLALYAKFFPAVVEYNIEAIARYGGMVALAAVSPYTVGGKRFVKRLQADEGIYEGLPALHAPTKNALLKRIIMLPEFRRLRVA
jgi:hypothetical protein